MQDARRSETDDNKAHDGQFQGKVLDIEAQLVRQDRAEDLRQDASIKPPYWVVKDWTNTSDPYLERTIVLIPISMLGHSLAVYSAFKHLFRFKAGFQFIFIVTSVQFVVTLFFALLFAEIVPVLSPKVRKQWYSVLVQSGLAQYGVFTYVATTFAAVLYVAMLEISPELLSLIIDLVFAMFSELVRARGWRYMLKAYKNNPGKYRYTDPEKDRYRKEIDCVVCALLCDIMKCSGVMTLAQVLWKMKCYPSLLPDYAVAIIIFTTWVRFAPHRSWVNMFILRITRMVVFLVAVITIVEFRHL